MSACIFKPPPAVVAGVVVLGLRDVVEGFFGMFGSVGVGWDAGMFCVVLCYCSRFAVWVWLNAFFW